MEIDVFQILGVGFPSAKRDEITEINLNLHQDFLVRTDYSGDIVRLGISSYISKKEFQVSLPRPHFVSAKIYESSVKGWPDREVPPSLEMKVFVDFDIAQSASGAALRHALLDPVCISLLRTPKTICKRIDIPKLTADINSWANDGLRRAAGSRRPV